MGQLALQRCPCQDLPRGSLLPTGVFIYPLEESEVVAGFEAVVGSRRVTFQVQNRHRAQDCCLQCGPSPGRLRRCAGGKYRWDPVGSSRPGGSEPREGSSSSLLLFHEDCCCSLCQGSPVPFPLRLPLLDLYPLHGLCYPL